MSDLATQLRGRLEPLIGQERERLHRLGETNCGPSLRLYPWRGIHTMQACGNDAQSLRAWMDAAGAEEVQPILCGYDDLLAALGREEPDAVALAGHLLELPLASACAALAQRWMSRTVHEASPERPSAAP